MNILCLVSDQPGHLDFGGMGYLRLSDQLRARGHKVKWLASAKQACKLRAKRFLATEYASIDSLHLNRLLDYLIDKKPLDQTVRGVADFHQLLSRDDPNVVLCDRVLSFAALALEQTRISYVGIGTPGGIWCCTRKGMFPSSREIPAYLRIGQEIKHRLGYVRGELTSAWIDSPWLNITFAGRSYVLRDHTVKSRTAFVRHYGKPKLNLCESRRRIGFSFGNTGEPDLLLRVMRALEGNVDRESIDVFVGDRADVRRVLLSTQVWRQLAIHGWVDFGDYLPKLRQLVFFGGIGTIWQCVNHYVPMGIVPGGSGDQCYNASVVRALGLGVSLDVDETNSSLTEQLQVFDHPESFLPAFRQFRSPDNYSDTIESVCERIEQIAHQGMQRSH